MSDAAHACAQESVLLLRRRDGTRAQAFPRILALHGRGQDAGHAIDTAVALFGHQPDLLAPQAARPCNPLQSNSAAAQSYAGYSWYLGTDPLAPEPASFGDALCQLELLINGLGTQRLVLCGQGQGAVLGLTLALYGFDNIAGVVFAHGALPDMAGWDLPQADQSCVRYFRLEGCMDPATSDALRARGGAVEAASPSRTAKAWLDDLATGRSEDAAR